MPRVSPAHCGAPAGLRATQALVLLVIERNWTLAEQEIITRMAS